MHFTDRMGAPDIALFAMCGPRATSAIPARLSTMRKSLAEHLAEVRRAIPTRGREASADEQATACIQGPDLSNYRPLSSEERDFLTHLLQNAEPDATAFLPQLEGMLAQASCTCGCPTISLAVAQHHPPVPYRNRFVADMVGGSADAMVGILLIQAGGKLLELEVYAFGDITGPFGLPEPKTLQPLG